MTRIAFYGSHNSAVAVERDGEVLLVAEVERLINRKNAGYGQYYNANHRDILIFQILDFIYEQTGIREFDKCIYLNTDTLEGDTKVHYETFIPAKEYEESLHHRSHAATALYQSDFDEALIVSFDGGGNDGWFNIYHASDRQTINLLERKDDLDLGFPYMSFGDFMSEIKQETDLSLGNLVYPGKMMGLCSYGKPNFEWLPHFLAYYRAKPNGLTYMDLLEILGNEIGLVFDRNNRISGEDELTVAATSQLAFETIFAQELLPSLQEFPDIPLLIGGGCGLNIILNTKLNTMLDRDIFVPPNPNDCGIAAGMLLYDMKPEKAIDLTYSGIPILDKNTLMAIMEENKAKKYNHQMMVGELVQGKIVGVVRGGSEHGPRALGNRSILCDPSIPDMKDTLNAKVKGREWFRPFAPVVRLEDVNKYFEFEGESRWMTFCPKVREEYRDTLAAITHIDGTARVQTVTRDQNEWLYDLLTEMDQAKGIGVLLNTSFNVAGKPILSTYKDAMGVFMSKEMDALVLENYYIHK
jgi:carbamoyltransferase